LNQHLKNVELQLCECYVNITKYRFNVEKTCKTSNVNLIYVLQTLNLYLTDIAI